MSEKTQLELVRQILEEKSRKAREEAKRRIIEDAPKNLQAPLRYLADHWQDPLRPALMALSCEVVGGKPESTIPAATAMTLMCASMNIYDHMMDRTRTKKFVQTFPGMFGNGITLIVGGLVTAKAFFALSELREKVSKERYVAVNRVFEDFLFKMAEAEVENLKLRQRERVCVKKQLLVLKMQACDLEACTTVGALIGHGSSEDIERLSRYGFLLGTVARLREDLMDALNLTAVLADKIKDRSWPLPLAWALERSEETRRLLFHMTEKNRIDEEDIGRVVEILFETNAIAYVRRLSERLINGSIRALSGLRETDAKRKLILIANRSAFNEDILKSLIGYSGGHTSG